MSKKPKFSIIVPVYNVEEYLSFCLSSIVNQTLRDIEIICVNDGSTDNSLNILRAFEKEDKRIIIVDKVNGGVSSARNAALEIATGEYLLFIDSDDIISQYTCDRLYWEIVQKAPDVIVFGGTVFPETIFKPDRAWIEWTLTVNPAYYDENCVDALFEEASSRPYIFNKCIKSSVLKKNRMYFEEKIRIGEDMAFLFALFPRTESIIFIPDRLYHYRYMRKGSLMDHSREDAEWKIKNHLKIIKKVLKDWQEHDFIDGNENNLYAWCLEFILDELPMVSEKEIKVKICERLEKIIQEYHLKSKKRNMYARKLERKLRKELKLAYR